MIVRIWWYNDMIWYTHVLCYMHTWTYVFDHIFELTNIHHLHIRTYCTYIHIRTVCIYCTVLMFLLTEGECPCYHHSPKSLNPHRLAGVLHLGWPSESVWHALTSTKNIQWDLFITNPFGTTIKVHYIRLYGGTSFQRTHFGPANLSAVERLSTIPRWKCNSTILVP